MVLDWLKSTTLGGGPVSLQELIARKQYTRAIEVLRGQMRERAPTVQMRLQLTDVLILAGRGQEAVPILLGLAHEFESDGWVAKAVAALKRVEKIEPGRRDTQERLASLVGRQSGMLQVVRPTYAGPGPAAGTQRLPEFGIEEISHESGPELEIAPSPAAGSGRAAVEAEAPAAAEPAPVVAAAAVVEPVPAEEPASEAAPEPVLVAAPAELPPPVEPDRQGRPGEPAPAEPELSEAEFGLRLGGLLDEFLDRPVTRDADGPCLLAPALLGELPADELAAVLRELRLASLDAGDELAFEGFFVVARGRVSAAGSEQAEGATFFVGAGSVAEAVTPSELLFLDEDALAGLAQRHPAVARALELAREPRAS